jgi:O-antigen ligase
MPLRSPDSQGALSDGLRTDKAVAAILGAFFGLALLKFGNPVVLDRLIEAPANFWEFVFQPWPVRWGYLLLIGAAVAACLGLRGTAWRTRVAPGWVMLLPCLWFGWQLASASTTVDPGLTQATLLHFGACVACFFLGLWVMSRVSDLRPVWALLLAAFGLVLWTGFEQHYGGLEATRAMFYEQPGWQQLPPDYIKKIQSNRIFATLVYPNALAAAILLLVPVCLVAAWRLSWRLTEPSRAVLVGVLGYAAAACLYWSGSKSGWLIALVMLLATTLQRPFDRRLKLSLVGIVLVLGLSGFFFKYAPYFRKGAPSAAARFDYWRAALRTAADRPVLGTGPGTFAVAYRKIKPPGAEMAHLAHNDYLEQASDSGWVGFLTYSSFVLGSMLLLPRRRQITGRPEAFAVWVGLLGWTLQSFVEFLLYIPALAWTAFAFLGWLWGQQARTEPKPPQT